MKQRSIAVVTGSRADYGLLRPVMSAIQCHSNLELRVLVTGMHLAPEFGNTHKAITADGFPIDARIESLLASDTGVGVAKSVGLGVLGFADTLERMSPDWLLVLGDRYETLAAVTAALFTRIPVAHIAGGDVTEGAYDEAIRHSITKMAHLHLVTNPDAARRVRQLGEDPARIHVVGSPALDLVHRLPRLERRELEQQFGFHFRPRNLMVTFHPATLDSGTPREQFQSLLMALERLGPETGLLFTYPNADDGGRELIALLDAWVQKHPNAAAFPSLGQQRYYSLLAQMDAVVGNSSSGLYEAPSFGIPTVNIGNRQQGRLRAASVIDCAPELEAIEPALARAFSMDCDGVQNPYGDGQSSERIVRLLAEAAEPRTLLKKRFFDLEQA